VKTTVLALGLYPSSGGPSKSVRAFADALDARVISWVDPLQIERERLIWDDSILVHGSRLPVLRQLLIPQAEDLAAAERAVAESALVSCHSFWRWHCVWLQRVAKRRGVPYWFVPHGILDPYVFTTDRVAKSIFLAMGGKRFLRDASAVVCATRREYEKLAHFVPSKPYAVIPWPLDEGDFRERNEKSRTQVRQELGIPSESFCLLYFGRLHPMKRPLETIEAVARSTHSVHLVVVGNEFGVTLEECRRRAKALGITDRVHLIGPVYGCDKHRYLDAADAYISLSHRENFNFTAAECLASGLPVILSPGNDLAYDLADVECGWMLRDGDPAEAAIDTAVASGAESLGSMGRNGRAWCERHLRQNVFQKRIQAFATTITAGRSNS
jgi:glycosyltransferase involved in cell wall biosynthesis